MPQSKNHTIEYLHKAYAILDTYVYVHALGRSAERYCHFVSGLASLLCGKVRLFGVNTLVLLKFVEPMYQTRFGLRMGNFFV